MEILRFFNVLIDTAVTVFSFNVFGCDAEAFI